MLRAAAAILSMLACVETVIVPEEIPTLLSVVYSNVPPIKLGFDTRFGIGFRIGPHADFQTLIELGPQENTNPIGMETDSLAKRQSASGKRYKSIGEDKKSRAESNEVSSRVENETFLRALAKILLGRKRAKQQNSHFGDIQFEAVPGIDDAANAKRKDAKSDKPKASATAEVL